MIRCMNCSSSTHEIEDCKVDTKRGKMKFKDIRQASEQVLATPRLMNNTLAAMFVAIIVMTAAVITLVVIR